MSDLFGSDEFKQGWESKTAPGITRFLRRLGGAIGDVPQTIGNAIRNRPEPDDEGGADPVRPLGDEIADFRTDYAESLPVSVGEGEGRDRGFGMDEQEMGTPRVAPTARPESGEASGVEPNPINAELDYVFGGSPQDRYSRVRAFLSDVTGERMTDDEMFQFLRERYREVTGNPAPWQSSWDAASSLTPDMLAAMVL